MKRVMSSFYILCFLLLLECRSERVLEVGFIGVLSGTHSNLGVSIRHGVEIAFREQNQAGGIDGKELRLIVEDGKNSPYHSLNALRRLQQRGIDLVIGPSTSTAVSGVVQYADEEDILILAPITSMGDIYEHRDYLIQLGGNFRNDSRHFADFAYDDGCRNMVIFSDVQNIVYNVPFSQAFQARFEELGGTSSFHHIHGAMNTTELFSMPDTIRSDCILFASGAMESGLFLRQREKVNMNQKVFLNRGAFLPDLYRIAGTNVEDVFILSTADLNPRLNSDNSRNFENFSHTYEVLFQSDPPYSAVYGYEAASILIEVLRKADRYDARSIRDGIRGHEFSGLFANLFVDDAGIVDRSTYVFTVDRGEFVRVSE